MCNSNFVKRVIVIFTFITFFSLVLGAQETIDPIVNYASNSQVVIDFVACDDERTAVCLNAYSVYRSGSVYTWTSISSSMTLEYIDPESGNLVKLYPKKLFGGSEFITMSFDTHYSMFDFGSLPVTPSYVVIYDPIPYGVLSFDLRENSGLHPWIWRGIQISPRIKYECPSVANSLGEVDSLISKSNSEYAGIYESIEDEGPEHQLALLDKDGQYYLVYVGGLDNLNNWSIGDVKAELRQSVVNSIFKATWYKWNKSKENNCIIRIEPSLMKVKIENSDENIYIKMQSGNASSTNGLSAYNDSWSGSGFALKEGYIVTNNHVIEDAKTIKVRGVGGDLSLALTAKVVGVDKNNDLALIKITDERFNGFGDIPYSCSSIMSEVGDNVFVLGYPLTVTMGEEIKLANGIISSKTGFEGNVSLYQISVPVQPGNSGGPVFDKNGNLIGVVCAKHAGAENVSYAIKFSYMRNLVESVASGDIIPISGGLRGCELKDQVKKITPYVFLINCSK